MHTQLCRPNTEAFQQVGPLEIALLCDSRSKQQDLSLCIAPSFPQFTPSFLNGGWSASARYFRILTWVGGLGRYVFLFAIAILATIWLVDGASDGMPAMYAIFAGSLISSTAGFAFSALSGAATTDDLNAYDLYLRGHAIFMTTTGQFPQAVHFMEQAIALDPEYGQALGWAAAGIMWLIGDGRSEDPVRDRARAIEFANRSLVRAEDDPNILVNAANVLSWFGEDIDAMLAIVDRALAINPNFARGWHVSGSLRLRAGDLDAAIAHSEMCLRLSPRSGAGGSTRRAPSASPVRFYSRLSWRRR